MAKVKKQKALAIPPPMQLISEARSQGLGLSEYVKLHPEYGSVKKIYENYFNGFNQYQNNFITLLLDFIKEAQEGMNMSWEQLAEAFIVANEYILNSYEFKEARHRLENKKGYYLESIKTKKQIMLGDGK